MYNVHINAKGVNGKLCFESEKLRLKKQNEKLKEEISAMRTELEKTRKISRSASVTAEGKKENESQKDKV